MAKPIDHAKSSAKKFGGKPSDYEALHQAMDESKASTPDNRHRLLMHHSTGIFLLEKMFGKTITNSDGKEVHVRDIGEQHVLEDLGFIPSFDDYVRLLPLEPWMNGAAARDHRLLPPGRRPATRPVQYAAPPADDHAD